MKGRGRRRRRRRGEETTPLPSLHWSTLSKVFEPR